MSPQTSAEPKAGMTGFHARDLMWGWLGRFLLAIAPVVGVILSGDSKGWGPMRWRSAAGDTHPLAIPLLGAASACAFGSLYWLIGVGDTPLHGALTFAILYGSMVAVVFGLGGIVWGAVKLLAIRSRSSEQQRQ